MLWVLLFEKFPHQPAADSLFLNSVDLSFLMEVKSDVIKDINSAKILIERTFFAFIPFMYLLMGSQ